jgi:DNA ligase-1
MHDFAALYAALDETNKTNEKVEALIRYFGAADPADAAWALYFLIGRRPRQAVPMPKLRAWAVEAAGIPDWLFGESYDAVGDFAETVALLLEGLGGRRSEGTGAGGREGRETWGPGGGERERPAGGETDARPPASSRQPPAASLAAWVEDVLLPLRSLPEEQQRRVILDSWAALDGRERFVWNKLLTGAFRVGVSQRLVVRALAAVSGVADAAIAHRLMGEWAPGAAFYSALLAKETGDTDISRPYPFFLAHPIESRLRAAESAAGTAGLGPEQEAVSPAISAAALQQALGDVREWQAEWKWDGIRAQLIRRAGRTFIWSRGEELVTERFPEIAAAGELLPDGTVLDGEILPWSGGVLPFAQLQRRIGRKTLGKRILAEVPVVFLAYDLLERGGVDVRTSPLSERRAALEGLLEGMGRQSAGEIETPEDRESGGAQGALSLLLSPLVPAPTWDALAAAWAGARARNVEGLMLKRRSSPYRVGRQRGDWWKWKVDPFTVDAVLMYAERGSGKRASLYTDYTFGLWDGDRLVPFAKAYSGLTDAEIRQVDAFVRRHTVEKFGPVRTVTPALVFELAFEGIQRSTRHKSGVAVRFPRILRWRTDKPIGEADTLEAVRALLPPAELATR